MSDIRQQLASIVSSETCASVTLLLDDWAFEDLRIDSLDRLSIACEIEEKFGGELPQGAEDNWQCLSDVEATVQAVFA